MRLQYDDWIMGTFITACYTVLIVMSNIETEAQSNLFPPGFDVHSLSSQQIADREYGSKIVVIVEQMQIAVIWACKACLLILYHRLTLSVAPKSNVAIKILAVYVALGFVVMEILYFAAWCRPFSEYWAVPTKSSQCNALINHRITNAVFNISSDLIMLCIALPIFLRSLLPWKRKFILCCIFSLGIFVILAAVLNKYYSFKTPYDGMWIFWYCRESSTAILVSNLPFTWTLVRKVFNLGAFDEEHPPPPTYHSSRTAGGRRTARAHHAHAIEVAASNEKHSGSNGSKGSRSMSLIGSFCAAKEDLEAPNSENSQLSSNGLLNEAIHPYDFAPVIADVDLERGIRQSGSGSESEISPMSLQAALRSTSPTHTNRRSQLSPDGTGGYMTSPRRVHLASDQRNHSRTSSLVSTVRRPMSPTPSYLSHMTNTTTGDGTSALPIVGNGGGRSAADRGKRTSEDLGAPSITSTTRSPSPGHSHGHMHVGGGRSAADRKRRKNRMSS